MSKDKIQTETYKRYEEMRKVIFNLNDEIYEKRRIFEDGMKGYHRNRDEYDEIINL